MIFPPPKKKTNKTNKKRDTLTEFTPGRNFARYVFIVALYFVYKMA